MLVIRGQTATARRSRADWRFSPLVLGLYVVALGIAAELVWYSLVTMHGKKGADFALVVYEAGGAVLHGGGLYDVQRVARDLFGPAYHLPPFAAVAAAPLGLLGRD